MKIAFALSAALSLMLVSSPAAPGEEQAAERRGRGRELGITIGTLPTGRWNAITDVAGVKVGHVTLNQGQGKLVPGQGPVRTGVTAVLPRADVWREKVPAGSFVLNGNGEMTGLEWIEESGYLETPIALTNTLNVGRVYDGLISYMLKRYPEIGVTDVTINPVVAECDDSELNDIQGRHVSDAATVRALENARSGPVEEGAVGAGTGMIAFGFKAGIGTSSRVIPPGDGGYTVGVLVNANMESREHLTIKGAPVGRELPGPAQRSGDGSIIIIVATDAPLSARQLKRLARRAPLGLARTGALSRHSSGDLILAFSTGNTIPHQPKDRASALIELADTRLNPLFQAVEEATEEAVLNALTAAPTVVGRDGRVAEGLPLEKVKEILRKYNQLR
ncbi:MAG TPA: P1 family peptidase [Candidatus Acidoferrales bacterium]